MTNQLPPTRTAWIDDLLRTSITSGELAPGARLVLADLASQFEISVTPVREALARLAVEGFVELRPHGSARVAEVSINDADEIYAVRRLLEPRALAAAIRAADETDHERWEAAYRALSTGKTQADTLRLHAEFHRTLLSPCPSSWMLRALAPLLDHSQRVVASIAGRPSTEHGGLARHRALLDLAVAGKADEAAALLDEHLEASMLSLRGQA